MIIGLSVRKTKDVYGIKERYFRYFKDFDIVMLYPYCNNYLLRACEGFVLIGGTDLNPKLYHEENTDSEDIVDEIDVLDYTILDYAKKNKKPVFGICRGLQVMNTYFGGTLFQNILNHNCAIHLIYQKQPFISLKSSYVVNSYHHQSIRKLGEGLESLYQTEDGQIEMIAHKKYPMFAVQFHPEMLPKDELSIELLHYFIQICKEKA